MYIKIIALFVTLSFSTIVSAKTDIQETVFEKAELYTVKIKTRIDIPFLHDEKSTMLGAGFVIDKDKGWILTNAHVAARSPSKITVSFKDGTSMKGEKIHLDPVQDIAILKVKPTDIPSNAVTAKLGCDVSIKPGHPVGAFGHPWNLYFTAARGITSGISSVGYNHYLQTDAAINHGNSGGPLISMKTGLVIGINTAKLNSKDAQRLNFAIPIKRACKIVSLIQKGHNPNPAQMPVSFFNAKESKVVKVAAVHKPSITDLKPGDIVIGIENELENYTNPILFIESLRGKSGQITLNILRDDKKLRVFFNAIPMSDPLALRGIYVDGLLITQNIYIEKNRIGLQHNWIVNHVENGSEAESEQFSAWDSISTFNGKQFDNLDELYTYLKKHTAGTVNIVIKRLSNSDGWFFDYYEMKLPINTLKIIELSSHSEVTY